MSALATLIAAAVAALAFWGVRRDSSAQTRPYIQIEVAPSVGGTNAADLIIRNTGRTPARIQSISASNWPPHNDAVTDELHKLFEREHTIGAGLQVRAYWALNLEDIKDPETGELIEGHDPDAKPSGFSSQTELTVSYRRAGGKKGSKGKRFTDTYDIHLFAKGMTPVGGYGITVEDGSIKTLSKKVGELTRAVNMTRWNQ